MVENNIPEGFNLNIPIYKGQKPVKVKVEIVMTVEGKDIVIHLVSPQYRDLEIELKDKIIDEQVAVFKEKEVVVIDV
jgi:hypothetical protein